MDFRAIFLGVAFAFIWASAFTSAKVIVGYAPPVLALAVRFVISGLIAIFLARILGQSLRLTRSQWAATAVFGVCQNSIYLGFNFVAMQTVDASLATIIASTMPLLVAVSGWAFFEQSLKGPAVLGLSMGFAGVALITGTRLDAGGNLPGVLLCIGGVVALTIATMALRSASSGGNYLFVVGVQMLIGAGPLALYGLFTETFTFEPSWPLLAAFTYTTLFPGLVATLIWFHLVNRIGPTKAATFHFLTPFFGVSVAAVLLGEALSILDAVGVIVITLGIFLVQRSRSSDNAVKPARA